MKKWITGILATVTLGAGGVFAADELLDEPVEVPKTGSLNEILKLGSIPNYAATVKDGEVTFTTDGESYTLTPRSVSFDHGGNRHTKAIFVGDAANTKTVVSDRVWGAGSKLEVSASPTSLRKTVSFDESFLGQIPPEAKYLEVSFDMSGDWNIPDGTYAERMEIEPNVWLEKSLAWDSSEGDPDNDVPNQNYTDVEIVVSGGVLTKRIPVEWLMTTVFPIYTDAVFTFGTKQLVDTGPSITADVIPIATDKAAICWVDNADTSQEGECLVASVSGTSLTFGTDVDYVADTTGVQGNNGAAGACSAGSDRWVVVYGIDDGNPATPERGAVRVASSTGTTVNGFGTALDFESSTTTYPVCTQVDTNTIVIAYVLGSSGGRVYAKACTINSDYTLTCGVSSPLSHQRQASIFADIDCETSGNNKFICSYQETNSVPTDLYANVGTVSGTTLTIGATSTLSANTVEDSLGHNLLVPASDRFVYMFNTGGPGGSPQRMGLGTVTGTTVTLGATSTLIATTSSFTSLVGIDETRGVLYYQQGATDAATTFLAAIPITFNWDTLTFSTSTAEQVDATTDPGSLHAAKIGDCKFLFVWEDDNDTNDLFGIIGDILGCAAASTPKVIILPQTILQSQVIVQ